MADIREIRVIKPTKNNDKEKLRVAAYCRVSTDSDDQINSFIAQVRYYNDYIREQPDMVLVDVYADEGITGTCMNKRDEFNRMMKDCRAGTVNRIFVKSVCENESLLYLCPHCKQNVRITQLNIAI